MNESEVDMDELEARLYGQVHHMPDYTEDVASQPNIQNSPANNAMRYYNRPIATPIQSMQTANYDKFGVYSIPVMSPPINNIVVLPPSQTQIFTHRSHSQKWVEQIIQACSKNKRALRKLKEKRRREQKKLAEADEKSSSIISTIDLSESCEPEPDVKNVCLISDDESNSSDDVIIVETKAEVINVDCEIEPAAPDPPPLLPDVGDSNASFDFLDNASLCKGQTSTPNVKKQCDSGRSSTLDYCDDLTGAEISGPSTSTFSELNLDGFTSYIASNGKRTADDASLSMSLASKRQRQVSDDSSDSSSESDAEIEPLIESADNCEEELVTGNESISQEVAVVKIDTVAEESDVICIEDDTSVEVSAPTEGFRKYWTDDMDKFYKESWGQENFSVIEQQRLMSDDPNMWKVIAKDRLNIVKSRDPRCRRCLEFGHLAFRCTKKLNPVTCCLCGTKGHRENQCPNTVCTSCGLKTPCYTTFCQRCVGRQHVKCSICDMVGHMDSHCPDLWRRYLFTIKEGAMQQPTGAEMKPFEDIWCSGCGRKGHLEQNCHHCERSHPPASISIYSFQNVYADPPCNENVKTMEIVLCKKWRLRLVDCKLLFGKEASIFLKILKAKTGVAVRVAKADPHVRLSWSKGGEHAQFEAMAAIKRFINAKRSRGPRYIYDARKATIHDLQTNLDLLNDSKINWMREAQKIYGLIQTLTSAISGATGEMKYMNQQNHLKTLYRRLNTIIITKLKIGSDRTHMDTLAEGLRTGQLALPSFEYVFNSCRILYPNYAELIVQLPRATNFEVMKNKAVNVCKKRGIYNRLKSVLYCYSCLIISDYSDECVSAFKLSCSSARKTRAWKKFCTNRPF